MQPAASANNRQLRLRHSSCGQGLLTVDLTKSSADVNQQSVCGQQRCERATAASTMDNVRPAAWQHAQQCNSQMHQSAVSLLASS